MPSNTTQLQLKSSHKSLAHVRDHGDVGERYKAQETHVLVELEGLVSFEVQRGSKGCQQCVRIFLSCLSFGMYFFCCQEFGWNHREIHRNWEIILPHLACTGHVGFKISSARIIPVQAGHVFFPKNPWETSSNPLRRNRNLLGCILSLTSKKKHIQYLFIFVPQLFFI